MTRMTTTLDNAAIILARAARLVPSALASMSDHEPGYPASTPGSGSIGGGSGGLPGSPVERLAGIVGNDRTLSDRAELSRIVRRIEVDARRALHIVTAHTSTVHGSEGTTAGAECCTNHERVQDMTKPVFRAGLCRQCYEFKLAEGTVPSVQVLEAVERNGGRMTATIIRQAKHGRR